jgi:hypothetical protein
VIQRLRLALIRLLEKMLGRFKEGPPPPPVVAWSTISAEHGAMPVGFWLSDLVKTVPQAWVR